MYRIFRFLPALILFFAPTVASYAHCSIVYPNGGETFISGTQIVLEWKIDVPHDQENWDIYFSADGGVSWEVIAENLPVSQVTYDWTVPQGDVADARIRVVQDDITVDYDDIKMFSIQANELPVELVSFEAMVDESDVQLSWSTASETNNAGFEVQQATDAGFVAIGFVSGAGTSVVGHDYQFAAGELSPGGYRFRLKQIDFDGAFEYSRETEIVVAQIETYALSKVYPNPFNPQTQFTLSLAVPQHVQLEVYDMMGRRVALLHRGILAANQAHQFTFEGHNLSGGQYIIRAIGETFEASQPALLLK